jgi:putative component of membrane protein insertase Oxa1/YidC/SpoIIIJ protein YidD
LEIGNTAIPLVATSSQHSISAVRTYSHLPSEFWPDACRFSIECDTGEESANKTALTKKMVASTYAQPISVNWPS